MSIFEPDPDAGLPIACLDFEASAYPVPGSYPIEVALAYVETGAVRSWLICPSDQWLEHGYWDPSAERAHRISLEALLADGRPIEPVKAELAEAAAGHQVVSDSVGSDGYWLRTLYDGSPPFELESVDEALRQVASWRGSAARTAILESTSVAWDRYKQHHRAGPDARRWAEAFRILKGLT